MRSLFATVMMVLLSCAGGSAAERAWKSGTWAPRGGDRTYVIETARDVITAEAAGGDDPALPATPGTRVQYAIEATTLYVLDSEKHEHALTLRAATAKYSSAYGAVGGGHYIKAVAPGGTSVTLEDGSHWDIDQRRTFAVSGWQPDDLITVRRDAEDPNFAFTIDNTTQDDGSLANYRIR